MCEWTVLEISLVIVLLVAVLARDLYRHIKDTNQHADGPGVKRMME